MLLNAGGSTLTSAGPPIHGTWASRSVPTGRARRTRTAPRTSTRTLLSVPITITLYCAHPGRGQRLLGCRNVSPTRRTAAPLKPVRPVPVPA